MVTELTQAIVHELLDYNSETGVLTWRRRSRKWFTHEKAWKWWNACHAGKPAFTCQHTEYGHLYGPIFSKTYKAHRIVWLYQTGRWPDPEVDHKNRKPADNRWSNLREVTHQINHRNKSMPSNNTSGRVGVYWHAGDNRWMAKIKVGGRSHHLGNYSTFEQAVAARKLAEDQHGFAPGHGRRYMRRTR